MEVTSSDERVKVEWVELGEGWSGDYDPSDPDDDSLLRFDVLRLESEPMIGAGYEQVENASYCTQVRADTPDDVLEKLAQRILAEVYEPVIAGESIKKTCERLSWIAPHWVGEDPIEYLPKQ